MGLLSCLHFFILEGQTKNSLSSMERCPLGFESACYGASAGRGGSPYYHKVSWLIVLAPKVTDVSARMMAIMNMHSKRCSCSRQLKVKMSARLIKK